MKIWYPINLEQSKKDNVSLYTTMCYLNMCRFKGILRDTLYTLNTRLPSMEKRLKESELLTIDNEMKFSIKKILNQYINSLTCKFDNGSARCYYYIPDMIKCYDTRQSLNFVIRLIEYGNETIPPLNWIRHSYTLFEDYIGGNNEC